MEAKSRLVFVDGLRGIASVMVVLYHLVGRTPAHSTTAKGYLGVAIFFVLSGFVIAMAIGERKVSLGFLCRFAARRALRLDPPYWASIAVSIALTYVSIRIGIAKEFPTVPQVLAHLIYLQDVLGFRAISDVYWTLCLEIQFYLFLIVLLWIGRQQVRFVGFQCGLVVLLLLSLVEHAGITNLTPSGLFLPYWFGFSTGVVTYWTIIGRLRSSFLMGTLLLLVGFALFQHGDWSIVTVLTAGTLYLAFRLRKMDVWFANPAMQFFGRTSYSLYLFHPIIGWSAQSLALRYVNDWGALAVGLVASVISAWVAYLILEKPAIWLSHLVSLEPPLVRRSHEVLAGGQD